MARSQELLVIPQNEVVELTNADVNAITFQVLDGRMEVVRAPAGANILPSSNGWHYQEHQGERDIALDALSKTAGDRVFAIGRSHTPARVLVDHA